MGLWRGGAPSSGGTPGGIRDEEDFDENDDFDFDHDLKSLMIRK